MTAWAEADDADLLALVRDGHQDAMAELWSRHYPATLTAARRISRQPQDAEEFASEAFSGMLHAISNEGGPSVSVRGYLLTAVRNQAANRARRASAQDVLTDELAEFEDPDLLGRDPVAHHAELGLVRQAFATLPPRWQMVLWRTAVDHEKNTVIAEDLGRSPNAVAALAKRARQGFRIAYLRAHESTHGIAAECAPYAPRLVELLPGSDTVATAATREHVSDCPRCARRLADLRIVDADLGATLLPALLTLGPGIAWAGAAHATHAVGGVAALKWGGASAKTRTLTLAGTAAGVLVAVSAAAFALTHSGSAGTHEALAPASSRQAAAPGVAGTQSMDSAPGSSSTATGATTRTRSTTDASESSSSWAVTLSAVSSGPNTTAAGTRSTARAGTSASASTSAGRRGTATSTVPPSSTTSRTVPPSPTPSSTSSATRKPTRRPSPPGPPTRTPPLPSPTSTKPPICLPLLCWPWGG